MTYRTEYPRPQLRRDSYENLNGIWYFTIDSGLSLPERGLFDYKNYDRQIQVPFCPESLLSGIVYKDFMNAVAYQREFYIGKKTNSILRLHFGACDYETYVYVNRHPVGIHKGGYTSFSFEIQDYIRENSNNLLTVYVKDNNRSGRQPRGKQCPSYHSQVCDYTRTTGIWQSVWLEWVDSVYIESLKITPCAYKETVGIDISLNTWFEGGILLQTGLDETTLTSFTEKAKGRCIHTEVLLKDCYLWTPETPVLYQLKISLQKNGCTGDCIESYFGMRDITFDGRSFMLNGKKTFLRLVLDQGFYPKGIYTAETEEELINDILLSKAAGFNGARLHQKVFEERFLYHCDRLGYLVFGEFPDAGLTVDCNDNYLSFASQWQEAIKRDYSHPAIIGWCPLNETPVTRSKDFLSAVYQLTRQLDPYRPVIDTSGFTHVVTDIYDVHDYEQDPKQFARHMRMAGAKSTWVNFPDQETYEGQPYFVSEYGGIWWANKEDSSSWGYGNRPESIQEFIHRYESLTKAILNNPNICGFCYTQLTDVEQEKNGLYTFDRKPKFDTGLLSAINRSPAAMEKQDA